MRPPCSPRPGAIPCSAAPSAPGCASDSFHCCSSQAPTRGTEASQAGAGRPLSLLALQTRSSTGSSSAPRQASQPSGSSSRTVATAVRSAALASCRACPSPSRRATRRCSGQVLTAARPAQAMAGSTPRSSRRQAANSTSTAAMRAVCRLTSRPPGRAAAAQAADRRTMLPLRTAPACVAGRRATPCGAQPARSFPGAGRAWDRAGGGGRRISRSCRHSAARPAGAPPGRPPAARAAGASPPRLDEAVLQHADAVDLDPHDVAALRKSGGFRPMPTPAGVPVAMTSPGQQRDAARAGLDQRRDVEDQVGGARVLAQLAVDPAAHSRVGWPSSSSAVTTTDPSGRRCRRTCRGPTAGGASARRARSRR